MERQMVQMVRLIDDLLDISRITRNKMELRKERIELSSVIQNAIETVKPLIEENRHRFSMTQPGQPIFLFGDPTRLSQVFANLLNNSAKYTHPEGDIRLSIERNASDVTVTIHDNGIGIPTDKLASIFEMFTQVDRSLERASGGLGIGLSLVRRLVEMHGGTVEARSPGVGKGSEFIVHLPILIEPTPVVLPTVVEAVPTPTPEVASRRILVVDDNRDSANSLGILLSMAGNIIQTAHDGEEAVERAVSFGPSVILLDIGLPKMNGYEAARRIRELPGGKTLVLVALTGWGQEEDRRRSREAGFDHHLVKPVDPTMLQVLLDSLQE